MAPGELPGPDKGLSAVVLLRLRGANFVDSDVVPKGVVDATCEMAKELLILDRTLAPPGEGISAVWTSTDGTRYSKWDTRQIISHVAQAMLAKYGALIRQRSGPVRLTRA